MSATVVALAVMSVLVIEGLLRSANRREMLPLGDRGHVGHSTYPGSGAHGIHADVTLICQVASGVVNAALGCEAVASVPPDAPPWAAAPTPPPATSDLRSEPP
jgi:hypothetical protein